MSRTDFYKSKAWNQARLNIWYKQSCLCALCNRPVYVSGISDYLPKNKRLKGIVHHKIHLNESNYTDDNISLNEDNLIGLCIDCHNKIHYATGAVKEEYMFDEEGNLVPITPHENNI